MKYKDTGFRAFYHHFISVPLKENLKAALKDIPGTDKANCILRNCKIINRHVYTVFQPMI